MPFGKIRDLFYSLSFRLAFWYTAFFLFFIILILSFVYYRIDSFIINDLDSDLKEEITEFQIALQNGGLQEVKKYMKVEVSSESEDESIFFRLLNAKGHEIAYYSNFDLKDKATLDALFKLSNCSRENVFETLEGDFPRLRIVSGNIGEGLTLQVAESFAEYYAILALFKDTLFVSVLPLILVSALTGWLLAKHTLKGVNNVTQTALKIAKGDYEERVQLERGTTETIKLANTFNLMLDRIQTLIREMRETNDNIAHDLRNPLARIRGNAELALFNKDSLEAYRAMAANTIEESDNLIDMINTMLDITEAEAGVGKFEQQPVDLLELIASACELFQPIAEENKVELRTDFPGSALIFNGDKKKLQRLITNLLENGIKYNQSGGSVTISVTREVQHILIRFTDTGQGIAADELGKIFDRFYRCDASRSQPGSGLGLSLVKAIAQRSGGKIHVQSILGQGSVFSVILPCSAAVQHQD
ncbi:MAG: HAMP domain-containing protein [Desulfohalobiaceae bacterium]|nr:HAMP domain-containing protein [Desulfohalobiaceae bacterium]